MDVILSDSLRRSLCRFGFLCLCILPTFFIVRWIMFPRTTEDWAQQFQTELGVPVQIGQCERISPQCTRFFDVVLLGDQAKPAISIDMLEILSNTQGRTFRAHCASGDVDAMAQCLQRLWQHHAWKASTQQASQRRPVQLQIAKLDLTDPLNSTHQIRLVNLATTLQRGEFPFRCQLFLDEPDTANDSTAATIGESPPTPKPILIGNRVQESQPNLWSLDTQGTSLPGWVLRPLTESLAFLPDQSQVTGQVVGSFQNGHWSTQFKGNFHNLDMDHVLAKHFQQPLRGIANVAIAEGKIQNGKLETLKGVFTMGTGAVGSKLLEACQKWLHMEPVGHLESVDAQLKFSTLEFKFALHHSSLSISAFGADGEDDKHGAIMKTATHETLVVAGNGLATPVVHLIQLLKYPFEDELFLTDETSSIARHLQLPSTSTFAYPLPGRTAQKIGLGQSYFEHPPSHLR